MEGLAPAENEMQRVSSDEAEILFFLKKRRKESERKTL